MRELPSVVTLGWWPRGRSRDRRSLVRKHLSRPLADLIVASHPVRPIAPQPGKRSSSKRQLRPESVSVCTYTRISILSLNCRQFNAPAMSVPLSPIRLLDTRYTVHGTRMSIFAFPLPPVEGHSDFPFAENDRNFHRRSSRIQVVSHTKPFSTLTKKDIYRAKMILMRFLGRVAIEGIRVNAIV